MCSSGPVSSQPSFSRTTSPNSSRTSELPERINVSIMTTSRVALLPRSLVTVNHGSGYIHRLDRWLYSICADTLPPWSWLPGQNTTTPRHTQREGHGAPHTAGAPTDVRRVWWATGRQCERGGGAAECVGRVSRFSQPQPRGHGKGRARDVRWGVAACDAGRQGGWARRGQEGVARTGDDVEGHLREGRRRKHLFKRVLEAWVVHGRHARAVKVVADLCAPAWALGQGMGSAAGHGSKHGADHGPHARALLSTEVGRIIG